MGKIFIFYDIVRLAFARASNVFKDIFSYPCKQLFQCVHVSSQIIFVNLKKSRWLYRGISRYQLVPIPAGGKNYIATYSYALHLFPRRSRRSDIFCEPINNPPKCTKE